MKRHEKAFHYPRKILRYLLNFAESRMPQSISKISSDAADFWNESRDKETIKDLSHWIGVGRWSKVEEWQEIGKKCFSLFEKCCFMANFDRPIRNMVEWGPGGGANAVQFCTEVEDFYGVDISKANLSECRRQLEKHGFSRFHEILIDITEPEKCLQKIDPVDFFLCTAVYQHFPGREYGIQITQLAGKLLNSNGIAIIQIRYDDGDPWMKTKCRNYYRNAVRFTSYRIDEFWCITSQAGFQPLSVILEPEVNYAYFLLKKEKK